MRVAIENQYAVLILWRECRFFSFCFFLTIHLFTCAYIVGSFLSPASLPHPLPSSPSQFQAGPVLPLSLILLRKDTNVIRKTKHFC
jgi:hypothetical protein